MRFTFGPACVLAVAVAAFAQPAAAQDAVVRIEQRQFKPGAGRITFSELPVGQQNPVYPPALYRGGPGSPMVSFTGHFVGRRIAAPADCPRGAAPTGCLSGSPRAPLTLDLQSPRAEIFTYTPNPGERVTPPALGGTPQWNGPIAILFDRDVAAVGLDAIGLNAARSTAITVYDRQGQVLGQTVNRETGVEFLGLATRDLTPRIAGLEFHLVGAEPAGFGVDNIRFGAPEQVDLPGVAPPPPTPPTPRRPPILP